MTNEEKAKEIVQNVKDYFYYNEYECGIACTLEMAKWKDEQYSKVIAPILIELDQLKSQIKSLLP